MSSSEQDNKEQAENKKEQPAQGKVLSQVKPQEAAQEKPKAQKQEAKPEEQANCLVCNKPIKKLTRYYRNGKFYCGRKCWRTQKQKAKKESQKTAKNE